MKRDAVGAVAFGSDFASRVGRLVARLATHGRTREGAGAALRRGAGEEWVGFRPYRPGDDPRGLDPDLLARFDRPYVRLTRREAGERWAVLLDGSASMGVGSGKHKLQAAAELAVAWVALAHARRALAGVGVTGSRAGALSWFGHREPLHRALDALTGLLPEREVGLGQALESGVPPRAERVLLLGDLMDLEPARLVAARRPGVELTVGCLLAPEELDPDTRAATTWVCPETDERAHSRGDAGLARRYERHLGDRLETFRRVLAQHRIRFAVLAAGDPFEDHVLELTARPRSRPSA